MISEREAFDALLRTNLYAYAHKAFQVIEPSSEFEDNWHIGCICEHLEAVSNGEIPKLIINLPPRLLKSVLVAQIFPTWELGRNPSTQFIGASYAHTLAERNVMKSRQIIQSEMYARLFPKTLISSDNNQKDYFTTTQNGQYKGTGIGGTITGFGCFDGNTKIITNTGIIKIKDIKTGVNATHCLSFNHKCDTLEWKKIEAFRVIYSDDIYEITTETTKIKCTGNHPFFIEGVGYIQAKDLKEGQVLVKADTSKNGGFGLQLLRKTIPINWLRISEKGKKRAGQILVQQKLLSDRKKQKHNQIKNMQWLWKAIYPKGQKKLPNGFLFKEVRSWFNEKTLEQKLPRMFYSVHTKIKENIILLKELCEQGAFSQNDWRRKFKIQKWNILYQKIQRNENCCVREGQSSVCELWESAEKCESKTPNKQDKNKPCNSPYKRKTLGQFIRKLGDSLCELPHYAPQKDTVVVVKRVYSEEIPVYDLQIEGNNNFFANGILVHNCNFLIIDDPISPKEGMSPTVRASTINEIRSTLFSRYNDKRKEKFVMIMQRLHEADPTGDLLEDGGYYHLKLPAYAPDKSYSYSLHGKTWDLKQGEYLSPRLDKDTLDKLRVELGQYNYVGQYLQDPVPLSGGEFNEQWIGYYQNGALSPAKMNVYILMDASGGDELKKKKKKTSDWSAYMVVGLAPDNNYYLLDVVRDRLNPTERINTLFTLHRKWNAICGKPPKVGAEQYGMMTDIHYIKEKMTTDSYHFQIVQLGGSMAKEDRIRRLIPDMQNGRWFFPHSVLYVDSEGRKFDLIQELVKAEMPTFPRARYDDMLDALSRIYDDELMKVFPKLDASMVQRAYNQSNAPSTSWEDY